jgi:hypothetical protein
MMVGGASEFDGVSLDAGDVVFMAKRASPRHEKISTAINVNGQRLLAALRRADRLNLRARLGAWSHVLLALGGGTVIHADGRSVVIETAREVFDISGGELHFRVFRRNGLSERHIAAITAEAKRYLAQKYSFRKYFKGSGGAPGRKREDTTQFCSRLVAHSFAAAGLPFSARPEHRVLPIDLYAACQILPWREVTSDVARRRWKGSSVGFLERIEVPGRGERSMTEFFEETGVLMDHVADLQKMKEYTALKTYSDILVSEMTLGQYASALLDLAKQVRIDPSQLEDRASEAIIRVLEQIGSLLDLALLPDLDVIVQRLNFGESEQDIATYAGRLRPSELHRFRRAREMLRLLSYLIFAETGLGVLVAHATNAPKFAHFRTAKREYAERFLAALKNMPDVSEHDGSAQDLFAWVTSEADRKVARAEFVNILGCLRIVRLLTGGSAKQADGDSAS